MSFLLLAFLNLAISNLNLNVHLNDGDFHDDYREMNHIADLYNNYIMALDTLEKYGRIHTDNKFDLLEELYEEELISHDKKIKFQEAVILNTEQHKFFLPYEEYKTRITEALELAKASDYILKAKIYLTKPSELKKEIGEAYDRKQISEWDFLQLTKFLSDKCTRELVELAHIQLDFKKEKTEKITETDSDYEEFETVVDSYKNYIGALEILERIGSTHTDNKFDLLEELYEEELISHYKKIKFQEAIVRNKKKQTRESLDYEEYKTKITEALKLAKIYDFKFKTKIYLTKPSELKEEIGAAYDRKQISEWDFLQLIKFLSDDCTQELSGLSSIQLSPKNRGELKDFFAVPEPEPRKDEL